MAVKERILALGTEGGGATIFRTCSDTGEWQYHVEKTAMDLDENNVDVSRSWTIQPVHSLEDALRDVYDPWVHFWPTEIHPEYRSLVRQLFETAAANLSLEQREMGKSQAAEWRRLCEQDSGKPELQVTWREWKETLGADCCGHGVELHDIKASGYCDTLVAFIEGFTWANGISPVIVYYSTQNSLTEREFNDMKICVQELVGKRQVPLGRITERIQASPNC